ncbi:MAG: proton-conducting transporter membrane subunit [Aquificaceae bacterium]|nr:proton-conducting transporter membrane subunit [Aquificaceae bacterium]
MSLLLSSFLAGVLNSLIDERASKTRILINLSAGIYKLFVVFYLFKNKISQELYFEITQGVEVALKVDDFGLSFIILSSFLWFLTTIYAFGYLENSENKRRFFTFFNLSISSTIGIALSNNLLSFFLFYELLTLSTYPLVVHNGTKSASKAGGIYLIYTLSSGALMLTSLGLIYAQGGSASFTKGGDLNLIELADKNPTLAKALFLMLFFSMAVKAGMFPLHSWLINAMVAPAPVSALLHAVAVVKSGAFGIGRLIYYLFGKQQVLELGLYEPLGYLAGLSILIGSIFALFQKDIKKRLAFSTVSQMSYILLGFLMVGEGGINAGLFHIFAHGIMKITLFMCAGSYENALGAKKLSELRAVGRAMPMTSLAFLISSLALAGFPMSLGSKSKEMLKQASISVGFWWVGPLLLISTVLTFIYLVLPALRMWVGKAPKDKRALPKAMSLPILITGALSFAPMILGGVEGGNSPLRLIK